MPVGQGQISELWSSRNAEVLKLFGNTCNIFLVRDRLLLISVFDVWGRVAVP